MTDLLHALPPFYTTWMRHAMTLAEQALPHDVPVGCVVIYKGHVVGQGYNQREQANNPAGHAEVLALQQAATHLGRWRLNDCQLVVTLEPCPMCARLITQSRIAHVIYGTSDALWGACGSRYSLWQGPCTAGVLEAECQQQLHSFFAQTRKKDTP